MTSEDLKGVMASTSVSWIVHQPATHYEELTWPMKSLLEEELRPLAIASINLPVVLDAHFGNQYSSPSQIFR